MMVFQAMRARNNQEVVQLETMENEELMIMSYPKSLLCIVGGAAAIAFGGDLTVDAASRIGHRFWNEPESCRINDCFDRKRLFQNWSHPS